MGGVASPLKDPGPLVAMAITLYPLSHGTIQHLCKKKCVRGPMWEFLTLIHWRFEDGHPELLFWSYVESDVKDDPSEGWYILMNSIFSIFSLIATTLIRLQSWISIIQSLFYKAVYVKGTIELNTRQIFLNVTKELHHMAIWNTSFQSPN